jgi:hypothetical protein
MSAVDPKRTFPSPQLRGYTNIIPPARKTKREMEMSKNGNKIALVGGWLCSHDRDRRRNTHRLHTARRAF